MRGVSRRRSHHTMVKTRLPPGSLFLKRLPSKLRGLGSSRREYVVRSVRGLGRVDRILDVGCAYGWALAELASVAEEVWGIDTDEEAVEKAARDYPNIRVLVADGSNLPFEDSYFDAVVLSEVVEHVGRSARKPVVDEVHRVLRPGGVLVFSSPHRGLMAWADPLDVKRRLPSVYRLYQRASGYQPKTAAEIGHEHLSTDELHELFRGRFLVTDVRFCGLLTETLTWVLLLAERTHLLPRRTIGVLNRFRAWETGVRYPARLASNIRLLAIKPASDPGVPLT
jgi:SAM-dependent methyltransferase